MSPEASTTWLHRLGSVRARITFVAVGTVAVALVIVGVAIHRIQESTATANLDEVLSDEAEAIAVAMGNGLEIPPLFDDDRVMLARGPSGDILAFTGAVADLFDIEVSTQDDRGITVDLDGEQHRLVAERYATSSGVGVVMIGEPLDEMTTNLDHLSRTLRWVIPLTVALLAIVIWQLVGLTLRPLERMRRTVAEVGIRELDRRVDVPTGGDELTRLALTLNQTFARLEAAIRRQQRFVADASHELRTPLARMRAEVEADAADPAATDATASRTSQLEEITILQGMVDDMLLLARTDVAPHDHGTEPVDLDDLVLDEIRSQRARSDRSDRSDRADSSNGSGVAIDAHQVSAAQVNGSAAELRRVIRNLLDNSVRHASSAVAVSLDEHEGAARLSVDDDGPGIPDEWRAEIFERFRTIRVPGGEHSSGAGLGLAIVSEIVQRHDGRVTVEDSPLGGARFVVQLPLAT